MLTADQKRDERYIGDGVYVTHDGYQVWLRAEFDGFEHSIALEPGLPERVAQYERDIRKKYSTGSGE